MPDERTDEQRKLDAEVAEKIMGWQRWRMEDGVVGLWEPSAVEWLPRYGAVRVDEPYTEADTSMFKFSSDMNATMKMIGWLCPTTAEYNAGRKSCRFIVRQHDSGLWSVEARSPFLTSYDTPAFADSKSLSEAVCRAALAAVDGPQNQETK